VGIQLNKQTLAAHSLLFFNGIPFFLWK